MRVNRSIQVEGAFGNEKQNVGYTRFRRRGLKNVSTEFMLVSLGGGNIKKLFNFFENEKLPKFWIALKDLKPQQLKKNLQKDYQKKEKI